MKYFGWHGGYNLSDIEIVKVIKLLHYISGAILGSGILSIPVLIFEYKKVREDSSQEENDKYL